jgi:hypothetical protein
MLLLPKNLEALAALANKPGQAHPRWATDCIQVEMEGEKYRTVATDGRVLGLVEGTVPLDSAEYPAFDALDRAPNGESHGLVKSDDWKRAFRAAPAGRKVRFKPILENVACMLGKIPCTACQGTGQHAVLAAENIRPADCPTCCGDGTVPIATLGSTNLSDRNVVESLPEARARFPHYQDLLPNEFVKPRLRVAFDPQYLRMLLEAAVHFTGDTNRRVWLEIEDASKPLVVRVENETQKFIGLLVPLS